MLVDVDLLHRDLGAEAGIGHYTAAQLPCGSVRDRVCTGKSKLFELGKKEMSDKGLSEKDTVWVRDAIDSWTRCLEAADYDAWATYWAEDGVLMPPGHPRVVGRAAIEAYVREHFVSGEGLTLSNWDLRVDGGLAVTATDASWSTAAGQEGKLKQVMVLRSADDGRWVRQIVIYNFDGPS